MKTSANNAQENRQLATANDSSKKQDLQGSAFQLTDNRPEAFTQRKLQDMANQSPQAKKAVQFQAMADRHTLQQKPVQLEEKEPDMDAGRQLNMILDNLEAIVSKAKVISGQQHEDQDFSNLAGRLIKLRELASGGDHAAKSEVVAILKSEMNQTGIAADLSNTKPIQRVGIFGKAAAIGVGVVGIGLLIYKAYNYIRDQKEDAIVVDYFQGNTPALVIPPELTVGVAGQPLAVQVARIFQNMNQFRFKYVGMTLPAEVGFAAHQGDCGTLVLMYEAVANFFGIPTLRGNIPTPMLVNPNAIHGRNALGNTEGESDWYFQNHHWVIAGGIPYDLLFMVTPPPGHTAYANAGAHNGVNYSVFADGRVLIPPGQALLGYDIQGEGRVFVNAMAADAFITAHP